LCSAEVFAEVLVIACAAQVVYFILLHSSVVIAEIVVLHAFVQHC
jgi:hypothetical protein